MKVAEYRYKAEEEKPQNEIKTVLIITIATIGYAVLAVALMAILALIHK